MCVPMNTVTGPVSALVCVEHGLLWGWGAACRKKQTSKCFSALLVAPEQTEGTGEPWDGLCSRV